MREILDLLKSIGVEKIKVRSMKEISFKYINTSYILTINQYSIEIRTDVITYTFDLDQDTMRLIKDFLNM